MENLRHRLARTGFEKGLLRKRRSLAAPFRLMKSLTWCALLLGVFTSPLSASAQVRVWEGTLPLPAYEEGAPDPNPPFDQLTTNRFNYPYTLRTNLTDRR